MEDSTGERKRKHEEPSDEQMLESPSASAVARLTAHDSKRAKLNADDAEYFYQTCRALYVQHVEHMNQEYHDYFVENKKDDAYWYEVNEYLRRISILKDLYQKAFPGVVLTCGWHGMGSLGYGHDTLGPKAVKALRQLNLKIVSISCGSTFTALLTQDGKVYTFGGEDLGSLGREQVKDGTDDEYDMFDKERKFHLLKLQVRGFFPSKRASWTTPKENEENCIIKVATGQSQTLYLTIHGNVYESGTFRDDQDTLLRVKPEDLTVVDKPGTEDREGKLWPYGCNFTPVHVYEMPRFAKDIAAGGFVNAAICNNGELVTWGVGMRGALGRLTEPYRVDPRPNADGSTDPSIFYRKVLEEQYLKPQVPPKIKGKVAISVACGQGHLMVVVREPGSLVSTVWASGLNTDGQLGLGDTIDRKELTPVMNTEDFAMIGEVAAGSHHTLAVKLDRKRVYACGKNQYGRCGTTLTDPPVHSQVLTFQPVLFPQEDLDIVQVACGEEHSLAIVKPVKPDKPEGGRPEVYTWGSHGNTEFETYSTLGHREDRDECRPRKLVLRGSKGNEKDAGGVWRQVSGGSQHSAFLRTPASEIGENFRRMWGEIE